MGAPEEAPPLAGQPGALGGAVKAGPSGPPVGEALRAPVVQLSPATMGLEPGQGVPGRRGLVDTADLAIDPGTG